MSMSAPRFARWAHGDIEETVKKAPYSGIEAFHDDRGVRTTEAEPIRHDAADPGVVDALADDRHVGEGRVDLLDIGALGDEAVVHHKKRVDRLLHPGRPQRMPGEGF